MKKILFFLVMLFSNYNRAADDQLRIKEDIQEVMEMIKKHLNEDEDLASPVNVKSIKNPVVLKTTVGDLSAVMSDEESNVESSSSY